MNTAHVHSTNWRFYDRKILRYYKILEYPDTICVKILRCQAIPAKIQRKVDFPYCDLRYYGKRTHWVYRKLYYKGRLMSQPTMSDMGQTFLAYYLQFSPGAVIPPGNCPNNLLTSFHSARISKRQFRNVVTYLLVHLNCSWTAGPPISSSTGPTRPGNTGTFHAHFLAKF